MPAVFREANDIPVTCVNDVVITGLTEHQFSRQFQQIPMSIITLSVLQGLERGRHYPNLSVPVTIGREEDNSIQLNDERISRCHVKIQQDGSRIILTDLESTNGTRVNGLPVKMTVLRPGDLITLGRCVLLYGSREEIYKHCHELHRKALETQCLKDPAADNPAPSQQPAGLPGGETINLFDEHGQPAIAFPGGRPPLPKTATLQSRSELADLLAYFHSQILRVLEARNLHPSAIATPQNEEVEDVARLPWPLWYVLLDLEADLAQYLKEVPEPD